MGGLIAWLAGCAPRRQRIDTEAVQAELQAAADGCAGYVKGRVKVQDSGQVGTVIGGVLTVTGTGREEVAAAFSKVLEAITARWIAMDDAPVADVRAEARSTADPSLALTTAETVGAGGGATVTTDDLRERFGL